MTPEERREAERKYPQLRICAKQHRVYDYSITPIESDKSMKNPTDSQVTSGQDKSSSHFMPNSTLSNTVFMVLRRGRGFWYGFGEHPLRLTR